MADELTSEYLRSVGARTAELLRDEDKPTHWATSPIWYLDRDRQRLVDRSQAIERSNPIDPVWYGIKANRVPTNSYEAAIAGRAGLEAGWQSAMYFNAGCVIALNEAHTAIENAATELVAKMESRKPTRNPVVGVQRLAKAFREYRALARTLTELCDKASAALESSGEAKGSPLLPNRQDVIDAAHVLRVREPHLLWAVSGSFDYRYGVVVRYLTRHVENLRKAVSNSFSSASLISEGRRALQLDQYEDPLPASPPVNVDHSLWLMKAGKDLKLHRESQVVLDTSHMREKAVREVVHRDLPAYFKEVTALVTDHPWSFEPSAFDAVMSIRHVLKLDTDPEANLHMFGRYSINDVTASTKFREILAMGLYVKTDEILDRFPPNPASELGDVAHGQGLSLA